VSAPVAIRKHRESGFRLRVGVTPLLAAVLVACAPQSEPRTVSDFMDDGLARDGVLTRCNQNREETLTDEECVNARRAAATLALQAERARASEHDQAPEARRVASLSPSFDVYAEGAKPLGRRTLEIGAAEPPPNDLVIASPQLELAELAVVPRPLGDGTARQ
jgi:hypothetical protein